MKTLFKTLTRSIRVQTIYKLFYQIKQTGCSKTVITFVLRV